MLKTKSLAFIISVALLSFIIGYSVFASWQPAPANPPSNNVEVPLNIGTDPQIKSAGLQLESLIVRGAAYLATVSGDIGIGTASPSAKLDVRGNIYTTGNISASNNAWDDCETLSWTCDATQTCPSGKFIVDVRRYTTGFLCGTAPTQWYQMRIQCCRI